jgi:(E)-4-hydroxy-3-methylbut-2-enyl-diphosphate synthase
VFIDGQKAMTRRGDRIAEAFQALVQDYVERRFGARRRSA